MVNIIDEYFKRRGFYRNNNLNGYSLPLESRIEGKRNILFVSDELIADDWEKVKEMFRTMDEQ